MLARIISRDGGVLAQWKPSVIYLSGTKIRGVRIISLDGGVLQYEESARRQDLIRVYLVPAHDKFAVNQCLFSAPSPLRCKNCRR